MSIYQWITNEFVPAFCRMLIHSLWIGALAAVVAFIVISSTKKRTAALRYNSLLFLFNCAIITTIGFFVWELQKTSSSGAISNTLHMGNSDGVSIIKNQPFFNNSYSVSQILSILN